MFHSPFVFFGQAELGELKQSAIPRQKPDHRRLAVLGRHGRDADIDLRARDAQTRGAVLRQTALGNVQAGQNLDARDQRLRQRSGRGGDGAQQTVDAHAHDQAIAERFDVNVARPQFHRFLEQVVDRAHDGRAARKIAQVLDVVVGMSGFGVGKFGQGGIVVADARGQNGGDILKRRDRDGHPAAEHDFRGLYRRRVIGIGDGELELPVRRLVGKNHHFAQKAAGKPSHQRRRFHQLRQAHARDGVEPRNLVREVVGRQIGQFPQSSQRLPSILGIWQIKLRNQIASNIVFADQILGEIFRHIYRHRVAHNDWQDLVVNYRKLCLTPSSIIIDYLKKLSNNKSLRSGVANRG